MRTSYGFPLLHENYDGKANGIPFNTGGVVGLAFPSNAVDFGDFTDEVTFAISLSGVTGAPTTWRVGAKFQILMPSTANYISQQRRWTDLGSYNLAGMVAEGVGFGTSTHPPPADGSFGYLADQTDTAPSASSPVTLIRTIRHFGKGVRVALDLTATGGTDPRAKLSIHATAKG